MRHFSRVSLVLIFFLGLAIYHNCSKVQFSEAPINSEAPVINDAGLTGELPDYVFAKELICGGARFQGKYLHVSPNECTMPHTNDQSCDRWGCALMVNGNGDADCPSNTEKHVMEQDNRYFLCLRKVITDGPVASICGGTRMSGKGVNGEDCTNPPTNDNSCNRWGCAIRIDAEGTGACPSGTQTVRISDERTYMFCLQ